MADSCTNEAMRAKYWELAGRALGFLEPPKSENTYIAVFQSVSTDLVNFLKAKGVGNDSQNLVGESSEVKIGQAIEQAKSYNAGSKEETKASGNV